MYDLCVANGTIYTSGKKLEASIYIKDGVVCELSDRSFQAHKTIDASGCIVLPGMIDTHVHIRGGKFGYREDFASGTLAAAAGGVTTILEMPIASPPSSRPDWFQARLEEMKRGCIVDFALFAGAGNDNLADIPALKALGAIGYKTFLMPPPAGREEEFYGLCAMDEAALMNVMREVQKTGLPLSVHAESNRIINPLTQKMQREGDDLFAFERSRPQEAETEAILLVIKCAKETGCITNVCHVSTAAGIDLIEQAKQDGVCISAETCPPYVTLDIESVVDAGVFARVKPPIRKREVRLALLERLSKGKIDVIGSDHAPYTLDEKLCGGSIWNTFDGIPSLELSLMLLLNLVEARALTYEALAALISENPANVFRLGPSKGGIRVGADADIVIIKKNDSPGKLQLNELYTRARACAKAFDQMELSHSIVATIVRGTPVFSRKETAVNTPVGKFIQPNF